MKQIVVLLTAFLAVAVMAQSTDQLLSILISDGYSVFSSITSRLGEQQSATSNPFASTTDDSTASPTSLDLSSLLSLSTPTETDASSNSQATRTSQPSRTTNSQTSATDSTISSTESSSSSTFTTQTSSSTGATSQSGSAAAASATSNASAGVGSNHDRVLAIVLGTVLGALALGLLILLCVILCGRRRRRRNRKGAAASLSSTSDEALTGPTPAVSRTAPGAAALNSRRSNSLGRRGNAGAPLMTERTNYAVPSPHTFRDGSSSPFMPGERDAGAASGLPSTRPANGLGSTGRFYEGNGLNNHPSNASHSAGPVLAAGAGGAALGAAAARRHSRSNERRQDPRLAGDLGVHPAFWDEPPPRSPSRPASDDFRRRSGSMPRDRLSKPHGHTDSPVRNGIKTGVAGAAADTAAGVAADYSGRQNGERGRPLSGGPPAYHEPMAATPVVGAAGVGGTSSHGRPDSHSRSRSRSHPPLPPSLIIPNSNQQRTLPSRSPKRTRFANGDTYHEPNPFEGENVINDPSRTATSSRNNFASPLSAEMTAHEVPMSPVSPEDTKRHSIGQGLPMVPGKANMVNVPARGTSPNPLPQAASSGTSGPITRTIMPGTTVGTTHHSGLVNAVQDHFEFPTITTTTTMKTRPSPPPTYQAYNPASRPVARKPVGQGQYKPTNASGPGSRPVGRDSSKPESWWRSQEDSAWADSYSGPAPTTGVGRAR